MFFFFLIKKKFVFVYLSGEVEEGGRDDQPLADSVEKLVRPVVCPRVGTLNVRLKSSSVELTCKQN